MYKKVLVPTDGSEQSKKAVEHAAKLSKALNAKITLLYVINLPYIKQITLVGEHAAEELRKKGERILKDAEEIVKKYGVEYEKKIDEGDPASVIVEYGKKHDAIIMASHGHSAITKLLLGSVADKVVRTSTVPVTIVK